MKTCQVFWQLQIFPVHSMYHTTLQATHGQLVLMCNMILNFPFHCILVTYYSWMEVLSCSGSPHAAHSNEPRLARLFDIYL